MRALRHKIGPSGRLVATVAVGVALVSCAPLRSTAGEHELQTSTYSAKNVVSASELGGASERSLYDALRRVRPELLWRRYPSPSNPQGYYAALVIDGTPMGNALDARTIPARQVREVRFMDRSEALLRYGAGSEGGAIVVSIGRN
ncbi:MAG: hypothetical protein ACREON_03020 [Gemmatimonadaceae bacterium]